MFINKYIKTAQTALRGQINGGIVYMFPQILLKIIYLVPLMFIWRIITVSGVDAGMELSQLLSYTYVNALLSDIMITRTHDLEDEGVSLFTRPIPVFGHVISRAVGGWIPALLLFSLPMALAAPLFGIQIIPRTIWVLPSLMLCASLGFAFEFIFYCVTVRLRNVSWLAYVIRSAIVSFFSGTVIPFKILPFGFDRWMAFQPFGSLGGAPLSLYVGTSEPMQIIPVQVFWNMIIWSAAAIWFKKSRERMVSFGG